MISTSDLWEAGLNMLTPAQASFSDLQLTFLTFQLTRLHIVNPRADTTHTFMDLGNVNPGMKPPEAKHLRRGL